MYNTVKEHIFWDLVAEKISKKPFLIDIVAKYKNDELNNLVSEWTGRTNNLQILKTDLFEEALEGNACLFNLPKADKVVGIDLSQLIVNKAAIKGVKNSGRTYYFSVADIQRLPFKDGAFDLVISNSTLDHLEKRHILCAILEMKRVLKAGGRIILTINNKYNISFYWLTRLGIMFKLFYFPIEFYTIDEMKKIIEKARLRIKDKTAIVHLIPPVNRILMCLNVVLNSHLINAIAKMSIRIADKLNRKKTKYLTGWFLAFLLSKESKTI